MRTAIIEANVGWHQTLNALEKMTGAFTPDDKNRFCLTDVEKLERAAKRIRDLLDGTSRRVQQDAYENIEFQLNACGSIG